MSITREVRFTDYDDLGDDWDLRIVERLGKSPKHIIFLAGPEPFAELETAQAQILAQMISLAATEAEKLNSSRAFAPSGKHRITELTQAS